jgi:hypothetical protein
MAEVITGDDSFARFARRTGDIRQGAILRQILCLAAILLRHFVV